MMLRLKQILLLLVPTLLLLACDQTQQTQNESSNQQAIAPSGDEQFVISGVASKGPIRAADINVFAMDANGNRTGPSLATTTTDNNGFWSVAITPTPSATLLVESSGGSYVDEADPEPDPVDKRTISLGAGDIIEGVIFPGSSTASITLLTDALLEKSRFESTSTNIQTVLLNNRNNAIAGLGFDPFGIAATDPVAPSISASNDSIEYAMYLGGIATALNSAAIILGKPVPDFSMMMAMVQDLSDGRLNGLDSGGVVTLLIDNVQRNFPDTLNLNQSILRFRNNNYQAYAATPVQAPVSVNETALAQPGTNTFPVATDDVAVTSVNASITIANALDNDTDSDGDALIVSTFTQPANGSVSSASNGVFLYTPVNGFAGSDTFSYTINDGKGGTDTASININVQSSVVTNLSPVAFAGADVSVSELTNVNLAGSGQDADGTISAFNWTQDSGPAIDLSDNASATPSFIAPDVTATQTVVLTLTVTDDDGATGSDTVSITVNPVNVPPTANAGPDQSVNELLSVNLPGSGSDSDGTIATYNWSQVSGPAVTFTTTNTQNTSFTAPDVAFTQTVVLSLSVTDNQGSSASDQVSIQINPVVNAAPTANAGNDQSVDELTTINLTGSGSDSDGTINTFAWSQVSGTTVTLNNGNTATPDFAAPTVLLGNVDVLVFQLTVTDDAGSASVPDFITVIVNPVLIAPTANAGVDQTLNELLPVTLSGSGTDDGTINSFSWLQIAGTPTVTLSDPAIANPTFNGPDIANNTTFTFQLTVTDNEGGTATDTVDINLVSLNAGPTLVDDPNLTTPEDTALVISTLQDNDIDPENNLPITITSITTLPTNGTAVIEANGLDVTYTPNPNFNGVDTFTYTALDSLLANSTNSATVTVSVSGVNDNPVAVADTGSVVQGFPLTISNLTANDTDPENDPLSITGVTQPANGVSVNNGDGTVTYTPDLTFNGADSFTYSIVDGNGGSAIGVVNVTVIADSDGDGETDTQEGIDGTDPNLADSDGDGFFDGHEKLAGTSAILSSQIPPTTIVSSGIGNHIIGTDTTWGLAQSPFWLQSDVSIQNGATLTIEPGVVVKSNVNVDIFVNNGGALNAQGNAAVPQHVVFTSSLDDTINGDTTGNGSATQPSDNDWQGIDFQSGSINGVIRNSAVKYGATCVDISNSSPVFDNVEIGDCGSYGILMNVSSSTHSANLSSITFTDFDNDTNGVSTLNSSVRVDSGFSGNITLNIDNLVINDTGTSTTNDHGLEIIASSGSITGTVSNITVVNPAADGINIRNTSSGTVNIGLSNLSVDGSTSNSLDVRNTSTGSVITTFDGINSFTNNVTTATAIYFQNNNPDFLATGTNSVNSAGYGLQLDNSAGSFRNFTLNNTAIAGVRLQNATNPLVFSNITLTNAITPYELVGQNLTSTITAGYDFTDPSVTKRYIRVLGTLLEDMTLTVDPLATGSSVWFVPSNITVNTGRTLTVNDGAVLKFGLNTLLTVNGTLITGDGVAGGNKSIFTSIRDDAVDAGGDSNGDLAVTLPARTDWNYITLGTNSTLNMDNTIIRYADRGVLVSFALPSSFSISNSEITQFERYGLDLTSSGTVITTNMTYTLNNVDINNGGFEDGIRVANSGLHTITLAFDTVNINNVGTGTTDHGIEITLNGSAALTGRLDNITVNNTGGVGIQLNNTTDGLVDPVFSGLNITNPGTYGLQLIGQSDGQTRPTVDDSANPGVATNLIGINADPAVNGAAAGSGGQYGLLLQGVNGIYNNITISNVTESALLTSGTNNPTTWDDVSIILNYSPSPWYIRTVLPPSIGVLGDPLNLGYTAGTGLTQDYIQISSTIDNSTLVADPLGKLVTNPTGPTSVWHAISNITIPTGTTLTVNDGAVLKFEINALMTVNGSLIVGDGDGTGTKSIFTSIRDNSVEAGGNSNGDATSPARTDWNYIAPGTNSVLDMDNTIIRYADRGVLVNFTRPSSFSITNSEITEFERYGLQLTSTGTVLTENMTYTLTSVDINNGGFEDGIRVANSGLHTITLAFDTVNINNVGTGTTDHGIEITLNGSAALTGRLDNITVNNTGGVGIQLNNTTDGLVDPVFSGLNITNPGTYGLQLIGQSDGQTRPTVDDSVNPTVATNLFGINADPAVNGAAAGSGGQYGLLVQGVNGVYNNITVSNVTESALLMSGTNNPTTWDDASIILNYSPSPWYIRTVMPPSIGVLNDPLNLGYTAGTGLTENYIQISSTIDNTTLVADPLGTGSSVWHAISSITVDSGVTLTVNDGAVLKFEINALMTMNGSLIVGDGDGAGTKSIFTSIRDNSVEAGGNSNSDATSPARTDWNYIAPGTNSVLDMDNTIIRYADRGVLVNFTRPSSFSITNSEITEFERYGLQLTSSGSNITTNMTYTLTNVDINNGGFEDGIRIANSGIHTITLDFNTVNIDNVGNSSDDEGIEISINGSAALTGRLDNITINNSFGTGIRLTNTTGGTVNPAFSGITVTNPGVNGIQLIATGAGRGAATAPTFDLLAGPSVIGINDPLELGSGGDLGMTFQGVNGSYSDITIHNTNLSALYFSDDANPIFTTNITLDNSPSPYTLIGMNLPANVPFTPGAFLVQDYARFTGALTGNLTLAGNPFGAGSHWRIPATSTGVDLTVPNATTLTINAGAILKFESGADLFVKSGGILNINGTNGDPTEHVVMTSSLDTRTAGNFTVATGVTGSIFSWEGIVFEPGSAGGTINFLDIWYARDGIAFDNVNTNPTFNDMTVNFCQDGLLIDSSTGTTLTFSNLALNENTQQNIYLFGNGSMSTTFTETTTNGLVINDLPGVGPDTAFNGILIENTDTTNIISGFTIDGPDDGIQVNNSGSGIIQNNIIRNSGVFGINHTSSNNPTIRDNIIVNNNGAGIFVDPGSNGNIIGNLIRQNTRTNGAGILIDDASITIENNLIIENHSTRNTTSGGGSGIYVQTGSSSPTIINNTIAHNISDDAGGGEGAGIHVEATAGTITLRDNIIFGNTDSSASPDNDIFDDAGAGTISSNNNMIGAILLTNNQFTADATDLIDDPEFIQGWYLSAADLAQIPASLAIDAGSANASAILPDRLDTRTTRTDGGLDGVAPDGLPVNLGYHYAGAAIAANATTSTVESLPASPAIIISGSANPVVITITPMDDLLNVIGAGLDVRAEFGLVPGVPSTGRNTATGISSTGTGPTLSKVRDLGDGKYEVTFTTSGGSSGTDTISIFVNGVLLGSTISITWNI